MSYNNVPLYKNDSKNKVRVWKASLAPQENSIDIVIDHGVFLGKIQTKIRTVKAGKNIGKANETSLEEQAELELQSLYTKQLDSGYVFDIKDYQVPLRPQLAFKYNLKSHLLKWYSSDINPTTVVPLYYLSKKYNGLRCFIFADYREKARKVFFESRTGKPFKFLHHLDIELASKYSGTFRNVVYDVELYHPEIPFEILCSLINSDEYTTVIDETTGKTWSTLDVKAYCYDIVDLENKELTYRQRFLESNWYSTPSQTIVLVENIPVYTEEELVKISLQWIAEGEEGGMLRVADAPYDFGKRTSNLLKYKVMEQEEFLLLDMYVAENDQEKVMLTLANHHTSDKEYSTFECSLKGNKASNLLLLEQRENLINKSWVTVDYQTLSSYKVPLFPVGVIVRKGTVAHGVFVPEV